MTLSRLALFALSATPIAVAAQPPVEEYLPEQLSVLVKVDSITELLENSGEGPLAAILENETIAEFLKPVLPSEGDKSLSEMLESETGMSIDEIKELFPRQAAVALDLTKFAEEGFSDDVGPEDIGFYILLEHSGDEDKVRQMLNSELLYGREAMQEKVRVVEEPFMDLTIYQVEDRESNETQGSYVVTDDLLMLSTSIDSLKEAIVKMKGKSTLPSFAGTSAAQALKADYEGAEIKVFADPKLLFRGFEQGIRKAMAEAAANAEAPNPMMPTADAIINALQLDSIGALTFGVDFQEDLLQAKSFLKVDYDRGIGRLLSAYGSGIPKPGFVPADLASLDAGSFDIGAFWTELEQLVAAASPVAIGIYQGQLAQLQQQTGVDLRQALINNLGPAIVTYSEPIEVDATEETPPTQHVVFAFAVKDRLALDQALNTLIGMSGMGQTLQKQDYLGHQVTLIPINPQANQSAAFTITDEWFIAGTDSEEVLGALARMGGDSSGDSFWDSEAYQEGLDMLQSGGVGVSYRDVTEVAQMLLMMYAHGETSRQAEQQLEQAMEDGDDTAFKPLEFDFSLLEELKLPFHMIAKSYKTEDGLSSDSIIFEKEEE